MHCKILALVLCFALGCKDGGRVIIAWDEPADATAWTTYQVHWGVVSGDYQVTEPVGTALEHTVEGLPRGVVIYLTVTAVDEAGRESVHSNEVDVLIER